MEDMEQIYKDYANLVYRFLYCKTGDADWAEEMMQETFCRAMYSLKKYDGSCKLSVWLCQIAKHIYYQEVDKRRRRPTSPLTDDLPAREGDSQWLAQDTKMEIYKAIQKLLSPEREVVLYRLSGELSFREIGELLGKSEAWARVTFYRAKLKIKEAIDDETRSDL